MRGLLLSQLGVTSPLWLVWVCLPPQPVDGGSWGRAPRGHDLAPTWLQSSQQAPGVAVNVGPPWPAMAGGGTEAGSEVCARLPLPTPHHPLPLKWPNPNWVLQRRCSLPGRGKKLAFLVLTAGHVPNLVVGLCSPFQAAILQGGMGAVWAGAEERTLLTPGS